MAEYDGLYLFRVGSCAMWMDVAASNAVEAIVVATTSPESPDYWHEDGRCRFSINAEMLGADHYVTQTNGDGEVTKTAAEWIEGWTEAKILCASEWSS